MGGSRALAMPGDADDDGDDGDDAQREAEAPESELNAAIRAELTNQESIRKERKKELRKASLRGWAMLVRGPGVVVAAFVSPAIVALWAFNSSGRPAGQVAGLALGAAILAVSGAALRLASHQRPKIAYLDWLGKAFAFSAGLAAIVTTGFAYGTYM